MDVGVPPDLKTRTFVYRYPDFEGHSSDSALNIFFAEVDDFLEKPDELLSVVDLLVEAKADVNACDLRGRTCLMNLLKSMQHAEIMPALVNKLISAGADASSFCTSNYVSSSGSVLHFAISGGQPLSVIETLLKAGADPHVRDKRGRTPADCDDDLHHEPRYPCLRV